MKGTHTPNLHQNAVFDVFLWSFEGQFAICKFFLGQIYISNSSRYFIFQQKLSTL